MSASALKAQTNASSTVKVWNSSIFSPVDSKTYNYSMVGKNPMVVQSNPVANIPADVIPIALKFKDSGKTFDPTKPDSKCLPNSTATADSLLLASPVYKKFDYKVGSTDFGNVQYLDGFQRENFAQYTVGSSPANPNYNVNLSPVTNHAKITVTVGSSAGMTYGPGIGCHGSVGVLNINVWDKYLRKTLLPSLKSSITPTHFPLFLFYGVVLSSTPAQCATSCFLIGGYHSGYASPAFSGHVQTYATADYLSSGVFKNPNLDKDVYVISHEVGEWMDDPFASNSTPAWGNLGQVSGCQSNLEVGDALTGTNPVSVAMSNGVTYNLQELAFRDWFYRTPSVGLNGWFSSQGTFTTGAGSLCS